MHGRTDERKKGRMDRNLGLESSVKYHFRFKSIGDIYISEEIFLLKPEFYVDKGNGSYTIMPQYKRATVQ